MLRIIDRFFSTKGISEESRKLARRLGPLTNRQVFLHTARFTFIATLTLLLTSHDKPVQLVAPTMHEAFSDPQRAPRGLTPHPYLLHSSEAPSVLSSVELAGFEMRKPWHDRKKCIRKTSIKRYEAICTPYTRIAPRQYALLAYTMRIFISLVI